MNVIFILVTTCIWALGLLQTGGLLERSLAPLSSTLWIVAEGIVLRPLFV